MRERDKLCNFISRAYNMWFMGDLVTEEFVLYLNHMVNNNLLRGGEGKLHTLSEVIKLVEN